MNGLEAVGTGGRLAYPRARPETRVAQGECPQEVLYKAERARRMLCHPHAGALLGVPSQPWLPWGLRLLQEDREGTGRMLGTREVALDGEVLGPLLGPLEPQDL